MNDIIPVDNDAYYLFIPNFFLKLENFPHNGIFFFKIFKEAHIDKFFPQLLSQSVHIMHILKFLKYRYILCYAKKLDLKYPKIATTNDNYDSIYNNILVSILDEKFWCYYETPLLSQTNFEIGKKIIAEYLKLLDIVI